MNPLYLMFPDLRQVSLSVRLMALSEWLMALSEWLVALSVRLMSMSVPDGPGAERLTAADRSAAGRQHSAMAKMKLFII